MDIEKYQSLMTVLENQHIFHSEQSNLNLEMKLFIEDVVEEVNEINTRLDALEGKNG